MSILRDDLRYRLDVVTRRLNFRLEKINDRLHILDGLLIAYLDLDEVIRIIREEDQPRPALMKRFALSEIQANAILDLRLRNLAKLEEMKLRGEKAELESEKADLETTLGSKARMKTLIKKELLAVAADYGDPRRSPLIQAEESHAFSEEDLLTNDPITVVLSTKGWVRAAKGHDVKPHELNYRTGDEFAQAAKGRSNDVLVFLDSDGRSYNTAAHTLPSARGQGEPLSGRFKAKNDARFVGLLMSAQTKVLLASNAGFGFVGVLSEMVTKNKAGKACLSVPAGGFALPPLLIDPSLHESADASVAAVTNQGRLLVFPLKELPELARGKGNKLINVPTAAFKSGEEELVGAVALGKKTSYSSMRVNGTFG